MNDFANRSTVVGVFDDRGNAERALDDLRDAGFRDDQLGILAHDAQGRPTTSTASRDDSGTHAGEGAAAGAVVGGVLGAAAALLIPGVGPVIAGGILASVAAGAVVGAAAGGIVGALVGLGIPEEEAHYYEGEFRQGRTLVTVRAEGRYGEAQTILRRNGAYDIEGRPAGQLSTSSTMGRTSTGARTTSPGTMTSGAGMAARSTSSAMNPGTRAPSTQSWADAMPTYRSQWQSRYSPAGGRWEDVSPYYQWGYQSWNDPRYQQRDWVSAEPDLQRDWEASHPNTPWAAVRQYVSDVWSGIRG